MDRSIFALCITSYILRVHWWTKNASLGSFMSVVASQDTYSIQQVNCTFERGKSQLDKQWENIAASHGTLVRRQDTLISKWDRQTLHASSLWIMESQRLQKWTTLHQALICRFVLFIWEICFYMQTSLTQRQVHAPFKHTNLKTTVT